jgi:hypothetical protein
MHPRTGRRHALNTAPVVTCSRQRLLGKLDRKLSLPRVESQSADQAWILVNAEQSTSILIWAHR